MNIKKLLNQVTAKLQRKPNRAGPKCEACGASDSAESPAEIGDYGEYGVLCDDCAKDIVPKEFYEEAEGQMSKKPDGKRDVTLGDRVVCPICYKRVTLIEVNNVNGNLVASCGDDFNVDDFEDSDQEFGGGEMSIKLESKRANSADETGEDFQPECESCGYRPWDSSGEESLQAGDACTECGGRLVSVFKTSTLIEEQKENL